MLIRASMQSHGGRSVPLRQRGVFLIEALLGILIFSLGILALIGMQAAAISAQSDARYRMEAANLTERMQNNIWLSVDRSSAANLATSLAAFSHKPGGSNCAFTGTASGNATVTSWASAVQAASTGLPGSTAAMQQIVVDTSSGAYNKVSITVCWQPPRAVTASRHTIVTFVN
jgi:type IV pilus assembly protein PilV